MSVKTYDPSQVAYLVGGVPISGFADGTFIVVERDEDSFTKVAGADGNVSRAKSNNKMGTITCTLAQTSPSNDVLSGFLAVDELSNTGIVPSMVKDNSGRTLCFAGNSWVRKPANVELSKEITNREWVQDCADLDMFVGGNADFEPTT